MCKSDVEIVRLVGRHTVESTNEALCGPIETHNNKIDRSNKYF